MYEGKPSKNICKYFGILILLNYFFVFVNLNLINLL